MDDQRRNIRSGRAHWGVAAAAWVGVVLAMAPLLWGAQPDARLPPPRLDEAVERGLVYLARQQAPDGSFDAFPRDAPEGERYHMAATGLATLAFLSAGHTPDVGRHGMVVRNAVDYLTAAVPENGYVGGLDNSRMYGQAIVTLALAQAYGVEPDPARRRQEYASLRKLIGVILKAQRVDKPAPYAGGWRYEPTAGDSDLSLSGWNALALRAAQDAGLPVPKEAIAHAAEFVARCFDKPRAGFSYQPGAGDIRPGTTATGVLCLFLLDRADHPEAVEGAKVLAKGAANPDARYPYYGLYYATQAAWQADDATWADVSKFTLDRLMKAQSPDGGWPAKEFPGLDPSKITEPGRVYRTAMSILTLTVPYRVLPVYQR